MLLGGARLLPERVRLSRGGDGPILPQPLLFLEGDRDYQVTVANDLDVWLGGCAGARG